MNRLLAATLVAAGIGAATWALYGTVHQVNQATRVVGDLAKALSTYAPIRPPEPEPGADPFRVGATAVAVIAIFTLLTRR